MLKSYRVTGTKKDGFAIECTGKNGPFSKEKTEVLPGSRFALKVQAEAAMLKLEGRDMPVGLSEWVYSELIQFVRATSRMSDRMEAACRGVLVGRMTWKAAAETNDVSQPGMLKAMRAMGVR